MVNVLPTSQRGVQFYRRFVSRIGLNEDHPRVVRHRNILQEPNEGSGHAFSPVRLYDSQIIYVDFAALLFEFVEHISCQATDDLVAIHCGDCDEMVLTQEVPQV